MPGILKIACAAPLLIGLSQLVAVAFALVGASDDRIDVPFSLMSGVGHFALGWGVLERKVWSRPVLIAFPIFQYALIYAFAPRARTELWLLDAGWTALWAVFFSYYCFRGAGRVHFERGAA